MGHLGEKKAYQIYKLLFAAFLTGLPIEKVQEIADTMTDK